MCCRYYCDRRDIEPALEELGLLSGKDPVIPEGEIGPDSESLIITGQSDRLSLAEANWGLPSEGRGLIINARAETALVKPAFSASLLSRRCVIPVQSFFEWDRARNKVEFRDPSGAVIFLAGFWSLFESALRFVVMTTEANESMLPVHDRMPLMIARGDLRRWLLDDPGFQQLLGLRMPPLKVLREQEQLSFF